MKQGARPALESIAQNLIDNALRMGGQARVAEGLCGKGVGFFVRVPLPGAAGA